MRVRRPSPSMAVSVTALVFAVGGSAIAAGAPGSVSALINGSRITSRSISGAKIKKNTLTGVEINESKLKIVPKAKLALRAGTATTAGHAATADSATHATSADSATHAATADNALKIGGLLPSALLTGSDVNRVAVKLGAGQTATLATNGSVALLAHCTTEAANDIIRVYGTTTVANSFLGGTIDLPGGATTANFLNPGTPEATAQILAVAQASATGTPIVRSFIDNGWVLGADGSFLSIQGETAALGINALGSKCLVMGTIVSNTLQ